MKRKTVLSLFTFFIISSIALSENRFGIGVMGVYTTPLYKLKDESIYILPNFDIEYKGLYIDNLKIGYSFYDDTAVKASVFINPLSGYKIDGKDMKLGYKDIRSKNYQIALGAKLEYKFIKSGIKTSVLFEMNQKGNDGDFRIEREFLFGEKFTITPTIFIRGFSEDYINYYFGVEPLEVSRNSLINRAYNSNNIGYSYGGTLKLRYDFNEHITVEGILGVEDYSTEISNSPIVDNRTILFGGLSLRYYF